jgi:hypothetical protein
MYNTNLHRTSSMYLTALYETVPQLTNI